MTNVNENEINFELPAVEGGQTVRVHRNPDEMGCASCEG